MTDTIFKALDLVEPGDLVIYHGSITTYHGLWIAVPCSCARCQASDHLGLGDSPRYDLIDPWEPERLSPYHVRRMSITRSTACA
jgi:hypothetical protein